MGLKIGCDIVYIPRFKKLIAKRPRLLEKIFTPLEIKRAIGSSSFRNLFLTGFTSPELKNKSSEHLAGIFAAKEAVIKALGLKTSHWHQIEIRKRKNSQPLVFLSKNIASPSQQICLSITHDGDYAIAVAVALAEK